MRIRVSISEAIQSGFLVFASLFCIMVPLSYLRMIDNNNYNNTKICNEHIVKHESEVQLYCVILVINVSPGVFFVIISAGFGLFSQ